MSKTALMTAFLLTGFALVPGCAPQASTPPAKEAAAKVDAHDHDEHAESDKKTTKVASGHDHSGWWCGEHGVPEGQCSQCSAKVAADFQKKGDWCAEHDRAKSQCFICDPGLKEKFAAQYRAKEGKEPPAIEEEPAAKTEKKS